MLDGLEASNPALTVFRLDVAASVQSSAGRSGVVRPCERDQSGRAGLAPGASSYNTNQIVPNPHQYMFWDDLHPTAAVHAILAQRRTRTILAARRF